MTEPVRLLVVAGEEDSAFIVRALDHPDILIDAYSDDGFMSALQLSGYPLAVVGGAIGSRGPLHLCEAVRTSREMPVVILLDDRVSDKALEQHKNLTGPGVTYAEFHGYRDENGSIVDAAKSLRETVLEKLGVSESPELLETLKEEWWQTQKTREENRPAQPPPLIPEPKSVHERETMVVETLPDGTLPDDAQPDTAPAENPTPAEGPPALPTSQSTFQTEMDEDDLTFGSRLVERYQNYDFRKPPPESDDGGADPKVTQLRARVHELERQVARLAFVYGTRMEGFQQAESTIANLEASKNALEHEKLSLAQQLIEAEASNKQSSSEREAQFTNMLSQAQQAFESLKSQSAATIETTQKQLDEARRELEQAKEENASLREQLQDAAGSRDEIAQESIEAGRRAISDLAEVQKQLAQEREEHQQERSSLSTSLEAANRALEDKEAQLARLQDELEAERKHVTELAEQFEEELSEAREQASTALSGADDTHPEIAQRGLEQMSEAINRIGDMMQEKLSDVDARLGQHSMQISTVRPQIKRNRPSLLEGSVDWVTATRPRMVGAATAAALVLVMSIVVLGSDSDNASAGMTSNTEELAQEDAPEQLEEELAEEEAVEEPQEAVEAKEEKQPEPEPEPDAKPEPPKEEPKVAEPKPKPKPTPKMSKAAREEARKQLRAKMFDVYNKRDYKTAVKLGRELERKYGLDWEAEFRMAIALQKIGDSGAIKAFVQFAKKYPTNKYAEICYYEAGELLMRAGKGRQAKTYLKKAAAGGNRTISRKAKALLRKIK